MMPYMKWTLLGALFVLVAALAACPPNVAIWMREPTMRADSLIFVMGTTRGSEEVVNWHSLRVARCGETGATTGDPMWILSEDSVEARHPTRVIYGIAPAGYSEQFTARPLAAGCYYALNDGGVTWFLVDAEGLAHETPTNPLSAADSR